MDGRRIDWLYAETERIAVAVSPRAKRVIGKHRMTIRREEMVGHVFVDSPHNLPRFARRVRVLEGGAS